ncbi:putative nucleic acid-binding protein [Paenibacillus endophyticus]|uniref:Putative nucleic acid-binding protein n=1 Tax=Paenibacillus endophyticus TaxID=1294268 RepID=A0A7W5GAE8_9BACL|nr:type II toxin-antitoxin system VapC family toxin [Paenibacillus endophyticus]MBB3151887.1 putative nucleic acid-binding protein [Paenibacillus endophyticus]
MDNHLNIQDTIFLDSTALAALMNPEDPRYVKARSLFLDLHDLERNYITTNSIIFELHEWLRNEYSYQQAEYFLKAIDKAVSKGKLAVISSSHEFDGESRRLLMDRPELHFSLSEAFTAVTMSYYQIKRIFTFNRNYMMLANLDKEIRIIPTN